MKVNVKKFLPFSILFVKFSKPKFKIYPFNAVESNLNSAVANGALDIFRNNGKVRWGAKAAISQYISRYGLPPTYSERILKDVFGVE